MAYRGQLRFASADLTAKKETPAMDCTKPEPLYTVPSLGTICPVCGKKSYSSAGIHPQCAVKQADAPREAALAVQRKEKRAEDVANRVLGAVKDSAKKHNAGKPKAR